MRIYQINAFRDTNNIWFQKYDVAASRGIDPKSYDLVYEGSLEEFLPEAVGKETNIELELIYERLNSFNSPFPEGYNGRSLSVSDVVVLSDNDGQEQAYYCDSVGFKKIEFT